MYSNRRRTGRQFFREDVDEGLCFTRRFFLFCLLRWGAGPRKILFLAEHAFAGRHEAAVLRKWLAVFLRRFFAQQWKRSVMPDGPKVGSVSLSPRGDWRMPSDALPDAWLRELEG